ncbi:unnamed protein product, partial [Hapterophycus canaliculatus]
VGAIVGGVIGGLLFVAAAIILAFLFKTGRLKPCQCCSRTVPVVVATPTPGGVTATPAKAYPVVPQDHGDAPRPPAYGASEGGSAPPPYNPV